MRYANDNGFYELNPFPGCNQLVISNHAFIYPPRRGKGYGKNQHRERLNEIRRLGYDAAICTVRSDNAAEKTILEKNGWSHVYTFWNTETNGAVLIYMRAV